MYVITHARHRHVTRHATLQSPFLVVHLESDEAARCLASRMIGLKRIVELWAAAGDYDELLAKLAACSADLVVRKRETALLACKQHAR